MMKKLAIMALAAAACVPGVSALSRGEKALGVKAGYASHNQSAVAGLFFHYNLSSMLRIAPEVGCTFRHKNEDALMVDLNLHMPFDVGAGDKVDIYPLAGLAFNSWATHRVSEKLDNNDVTTHINRFGANVGAGFDLRCSSTLKLNIEAKYTFVKHFSSVYLTAGICYVF